MYHLRSHQKYDITIDTDSEWLICLAAVLGITQGMADFLGPFGIRVNSVSPAVVASSIMGPDRIVSAISGGFSDLLQLTKQPFFVSELEAGAIYPRRVSEPDEVASGVMYLLENSMMNDFELRIDGGWRGSSNWAGEKDRECNQAPLLSRSMNCLTQTARSNALSLE